MAATDRGLLLADGAFETMRAHGGSIFRLDAHLARLRRALDVLAIAPPLDLPTQIAAAVADAPWPDLAVRLTVTRGVGSSLLPEQGILATAVLIVRPLPVIEAALSSIGLSAHVASGRRNPRSMTAGLKVLAYTDAVAALVEARAAGADEALFLDTEGDCSEASASNLFIVAADTLRTPPLTCAALPGITRATVIELARSRAVRVDDQTAFDPSALFAAEEAFLTSTLRGLAPLTRVNGRAIGFGVPGPRTLEMLEAWQVFVLQTCAGHR